MKPDVLHTPVGEARAARCSVILVLVLVVHALLLISPIVYSLGFRESVVVPLTVALVVGVAAFHGRRFPSWVLLAVVASFATSAVAGVFWESLRAALLPAYFCAALLTVSIATRQEMERLVNISSAALLLMLIAGWIGLFLAFEGVPPLHVVSGIHARPLYYFYTTLTPTLIGRFIRPSGIYDEPGALALVVCLVAFMRSAMHMDRRYTWVLLILGFVTFSIAHLVYVTIHFLSERRIVLAWANLAVVFMLIIVALSRSGLWGYFDQYLVDRLALTQRSEAVVAGDNRTGDAIRAARTISSGGARVFFFGVDISCIEGMPACHRDYGGLGFNPLGPLAQYGVLIAWPFYVFFISAFAAGALHRSWWPFVGVDLFYMQRPDLFSAGYALLAVASVFVFLRYCIRPGLEEVVGRFLSSSRLSKVSVGAQAPGR